jgi:hypothetical protein
LQSVLEISYSSNGREVAQTRFGRQGKQEGGQERIGGIKPS